MAKQQELGKESRCERRRGEDQEIQDSRKVTLDIAQLTLLAWYTAAEGLEQKSSSLGIQRNEERTRKAAQFFLLHTESLSNSACSCGKWNITIFHPSLRLISALVDSIKRKAKRWLS